MAKGPLAGIKVLEIAGIGPGPFCGMMLADMGADVVRIDRAVHGQGRDMGRAPIDVLARGRRSVAVDLKSSDGIAVVLRLVEQADVLLEGFRPGVMERLGLGPDVWRLLAKCHEIRNLGEYEGDLNVDERLVADLVTACQKVADTLEKMESLPSK